MKHRDLHIRGIGLLELMRCQPAQGLGRDTAGGYMASLGSAQLLPNVLQHVVHQGQGHCQQMARIFPVCNATHLDPAMC